MPENQDWTAVYPSAAPFKPSAVPLPVRMGYPVNRGVPAEKKGNLELMKVRLPELYVTWTLMSVYLNDRCLTCVEEQYMFGSIV